MYSLKKDNKRLIVCKLKFLRTLEIGEWTAREWSLKGQHKTSLNVPLKPNQNQDLETFLNKLPKMPPQHCKFQSTRNKLYLESIFKIQKEVYAYPVP